MKNKMGDFMKFLKYFLLWFITIIYFELIFNIFSYDNLLFSTFVNIFVFASFFALLFSLICGLINKNSIIRNILLFVFGFYFSAQFIFYDVFLSYFSFSMLGMSEQLVSFLPEAVNVVLENFYVVILFFLPFILNIIFRKKLVIERFNKFDYLYSLIALIIVLIMLVFNINFNKNKANSVYDLLFNINENALNIEKLGVIPSIFIDITRSIFGFENEVIIEPEVDEPEDIITEYGYNVLDISFNNTSNKNIKAINDYINSITPSQKNEYTGIFKGYNLIYITAESFSELGVSEELTPTLYKLMNSGFVFNNFYTPNNTSTLGGEFQSITGLFANGTALSQWRKGTNTFPQGLSTVFENVNYNTFAYHNHNYAFQNRNKYMKSLGFDNYKGCYNGMEKLINCKSWPESDDEMMTATINEYVDKQPFLAYYMTVSGHLEYNFDGGNAMALKHKSKVEHLNYSNEVKAYLATQIELDLALENLLKTLEEKGVLDKTVIVMQADHYPYRLSLKDINSLSTYKRDSIVEANHNALIIWNPNIEKTVVDKVCMSIDVIPTVYNLFGIEYDSRLFVGNDIFSNKDGLAMFANRSWVTEYGTYYANSSKFVPNSEDVSSEYIEKINNIVNNRMNISKMIINNNYYKYITINE